MELFHTKNKKNAENKNPGVSSQKYVDVEEIKNDLMILKNGSLRAVVAVSSINFDLKSSDEQDAIIIGYQNFLNALDFPTQTMIVSKNLDIEPYLADLDKRRKTQKNSLIKMQIAEYINFVKNLTEISDIMTKSFYIVIPFYPVENREEGFFDKISAMVNQRQRILENAELLETYKNQLWQRVGQVKTGLTSLGIKTAILNTEEIVELLYSSYNPSVYSSATIKDLGAIDLER
jgi:hypothetical protein